MKKNLLVILSAVCILGVTGKLGRNIMADIYGTLSKEQIIQECTVTDGEKTELKKLGYDYNEIFDKFLKNNTTVFTTHPGLEDNQKKYVFLIGGGMQSGKTYTCDGIAGLMLGEIDSETDPNAVDKDDAILLSTLQDSRREVDRILK